MQLGLFQKQTMNLVMTTELRQAIALLQYSSMELSEFIQEEAMENPLIELEEKPPEISVEEKYEPNFSRSIRSNHDEDVSPLDFIPNEDKSLWEDLLEQVQFLPIKEQDRIILNYLVLNLDDNGYLTISNEEVATMLSTNEETVEHCVEILQGLEPIGIGARDLKECLLLQAQAYYPDDTNIELIIRDYLDLLANKKWQEIARTLNITLKDVKKIAEQIQKLNPKPCARMNNATASYLYPDITIEEDNGNYVVSLNDNYIPKIHLNQEYMPLLKGNNETSKYVNQNYKKYMWLINSIEQRRNTILKIAKVIVKKQRDFLKNGFASLQAMTLKEVAVEIEMHESTVSRATSNKVIRTPAGSFEMSRLFTSSLGKSDGSNASSAKVKILLKEVIDKEDKKKPYSDQKIADYFKKENGITISRRTVAKYREELNILSSAKRKEIV